ncbi:hypothetical protein [Solicola gregarius]|uniref:Uncharacterized protein n=1 Tax=Solicola gregarius TaxID=2908642 RepID=A0AA46YK89_9ACTN|nr:hypothetical protein [Solicola gregarius]UYM05247.1 hypothetical protein L0C25_22475 [Solicola gregarius]
MKRLATMAATTVLAIGTLTACGGSDGDSGDGGGYCDQVKDAQGEFSDLESADLTMDDLSSMGDKIGDIADSAPDEVSSEWGSVGSAVDDMVGALEDADVASDKPLNEAVTEAVQKDPDLRARLSEQMSSFQDAQSNIETVQKNVKEECDIDLGDSE